MNKSAFMESIQFPTLLHWGRTFLLFFFSFFNLFQSYTLSKVTSWLPFWLMVIGKKILYPAVEVFHCMRKQRQIQYSMPSPRQYTQGPRGNHAIWEMPYAVKRLNTLAQSRKAATGTINDSKAKREGNTQVWKDESSYWKLNLHAKILNHMRHGITCCTVTGMVLNR